MGDERRVHTDTAMHHACLQIAMTHCPYLRNSERAVRIVEVGRDEIVVDGRALTDIADYGDDGRSWTVSGR
ncbi:hypothetical protein M8C13_07235 [Crossiella sp. SN42]|uniref:hypothetical protein n=1 Tax=Crossiella sp. SN42 TaxID=2944808 RepID=UPI00207C8F2E|nr:hypothetical protein [Crossiella sp. SN42]MCO1575550.1 hypothetical protein [Crossiella sp. SN42]